MPETPTVEDGAVTATTPLARQIGTRITLNLVLTEAGAIEGALDRHADALDAEGYAALAAEARELAAVVHAAREQGRYTTEPVTC